MVVATRANQEGDKVSNIYNVWKKHNECTHVEGVSIRSRNSAPSRKGCVVNGRMTKARNK